ncbi:par-3 family cell polarity regulator beta a [Erpetoichthys calabaricus]|uniref:par-3 family cell polarity regulator beta a n=1 Tax=Erpetoichthys calabaricus TaxID=27687 RepID=UPI002234E3E0|nr:par-3 family cell polarity regulator beta a [Erpetoichthys calabaricus]
MKVTVCFGRTGVVVPCRDGWTVRELTEQAAQRYRKTLEKDGTSSVKIHHIEYLDGSILDPDDVLSDLVEDKDKLIAVYEEQPSQRLLEGAGGQSTGRASPDPFENELATQLAAFQPIGGEIEVNSSALKSSTPLLVRRSSDPALGLPVHFQAGHSLLDNGGHQPVVTVLSPEPEAVVPEDVPPAVTLRELTRKVDFAGEDGPLGIHVVPYCSSLSGRMLGLFIRGVEEKSRSRREGLFQENECIVKINDIELKDKLFTQSQEIFRQAMRGPAVHLEVLPVHNCEQYEKTLIAHLFRKEQEEQKLAEDGPPQQTGMVLPPSGEPTLVRKSSTLSPLLGFGNKKLGKKVRIDLKKGPEGLGFTVVTRDSSVHGPGPILVKNILPRGAAVKDGRLQFGDRILEVNGKDITGKSQEELVAMLRGTKQGETVSLLVARQEDGFLPRELKGERPLQEGKEQLLFEIPLNDSGSAGLGVSLKGNKSRETGADLGIFIKSIIHGGAAYKDGRLRANDQLIAVNGESLLGKSNHEAMETLRRSMSMEGNIRGMIQLVVRRSVDKPTEDAGGVAQKKVGSGSLQLLSGERLPVSSQMENLDQVEEDNDEAPALPPPPNHGMDAEDFHSEPAASQLGETGKLKTSKSMDLVADESNVGSLVEQVPAALHADDVGPTLGLKKSSSLESLQTAVAEVRKNELPFHRPRPHMVRGRGCNESFRAAIDKSYDGPPDLAEDGLSDESSGRETPASGSSRQGVGEAEEGRREEKKKKSKEKKKEKAKGKEKEKKRPDEGEEQDKKARKKGFGAMLRFGRRREEKAKMEPKVAVLSKAKSDMLSEEELEKMKEERERIEAKHQELRERQAREKTPGHGAQLLPDMEDDEADPSYARINNFRDRPGTYREPSPHLAPVPVTYARVPPAEGDFADSLYAKVNKARSPPSPHADSSSNDRIQQLRMEYHQARREGTMPSYEELEVRRRGLDYEQHRVAGRGHDGHLAVPPYEERQYASLPRRGVLDPNEFPKYQRAAYGERDVPPFPGAQPVFPVYPGRGSHLMASDRRALAPQQRDMGHYATAPSRGPFRQDVPPSPPLPQRTPHYDSLGRAPYLGPAKEVYSYGDPRSQDPRQKNSMTAAV